MKKILKWFLILIGTVAVSVGISLTISTNLSTETIAQIEENTTKQASGQCSPNPIILIRENLEGYGADGSKLFRPIAADSDLELYCVEPGAALGTSGSVDYSELQEYVSSYHTSSAHGCATPPREMKTLPYYYCHGEHYTESSTTVYGRYVGNLYDAGYAASFFPDGAQTLNWDDNQWSGGKQQAIWMLYGLNKRDDPNRGTYRTEGELIVEEATAYREFYEKIMEKDQNGNIGMKPKDITNYENVSVSTDTNNQTHIIGPFTIDYVKGRYRIEGPYGTYNMAFGGISDMWLVDEDGRRIEIQKFIRPEIGSYKEPSYFDTFDTEEGKPNPNCVDYYDNGRNYPDPNEPFYVEIAYTGEESTSYTLNAEFQYMKSTAKFCVREGIRYVSAPSDRDTPHTDPGDPPTPCHSCDMRAKIDTIDQQDLVYVVESNREIITESFTGGPDDNGPPAKTMKLGGYVFEDTPSGKEQDVDGVMNEGERIIPGAKVTLYEVDDNGNRELAQLRTLRDENPNISDAEVNDPDDYTRRINPTLSDAYGYYEFRGLDTEKNYIVEFEYNGQIYMPTEYLAGTGHDSVSDMVDANQYDTAGTKSEQWRQTSKALEVASERTTYDQRFAEIRSYPENYTMNPDGLSLISGSNGYNVAFSIYDLMGFNLTADGTYEQKLDTPLIDTYYYLDNGVIMIGEDIKEGLITTRIREFIDQNKKYPSDQEMRNIYTGIVNEIAGDLDGGQQEAWQMIQFVEDSKISAYTINNMNNANSYDIYPVYNDQKADIKNRRMTTNVESGNEYPYNSYNRDTHTHDSSKSVYTNKVYPMNGELREFKNIYEGQLFVNCGLWRRQEADMAINKDVYKAALKINDKTIVYNYDKRSATVDEQDGDNDGKNNEDGNQDNQTYWDIYLRMSDYDNYYGKSYSEDGQAGYMREIYPTDYLFDTPGEGGIAPGHPGDPLEVYITYKITVRNQSMSILTEIEEVVDYYDQDYTFKPNLSWVMYRGSNTEEPPRVNEDEYYSVMASNQEDMNNVSVIGKITGARDVKNNNTKYPGTEENLGNGYQNVYINGLDGKKLESGESAYIYLTFQVNKENERVILDGGEYSTTDTPKENIAEINGFTTYYKDGTTLPNYGGKGQNDIAGLVDRDSTPGNLVAEDLEGERYEQNFEDDTDRAPSLRVRIDAEAIRRANGIVWEDERTENVDGALIGDGIRQEGETPVAGVTVELIEKCVDGSEYRWGEPVSTNENGEYLFENYIPGDYIIRFKYGNTDATALSTESKGSQGSNIVSYNGQDFKSTTYQDGIEQSEYTDISRRYQGYRNTATQNVTATYNGNENAGNTTDNTFGYDIYASDAATAENENYSDAKDLWTAGDRSDLHGRDNVISYSQSNVTNHKAEVLASPYVVPTYDGTEYSDDEMRALYDELIDNTQMTAETGMIVVEFEYDRQQSDGLNSTINDETNSSHSYIVLDGIEDNRQNSNYTLKNIDFGLTERPKAQLEIDKSVANVKVTLANGTPLFDIVEAANNALWQDHKEYSIDEIKEDYEGIYPTYYSNDTTYPKNQDHTQYHRYSYRTVANGINDIVQSTDKGLIQLTMDEELMHGATIQITYTVKITNVGETDYYDTGDAKNYYYLGNRDGSEVVTTVANQVVDYVQNNLQFDENNEANMDDSGQGVNARDGWKLITVENLTKHDEVNEDLVNRKLEPEGEDFDKKKLSAFNTIVQTESFGSDNLVPGQETTRTIVLSQLITPQNTDDDLTYGNMVEIVKTSNTVGRRMAYSVVGNQDPSLSDASEVDANVAERIVILPPFGEVRIYYILGAVVAVMLIGGIILIRRKVLKGKDKTE